MAPGEGENIGDWENESGGRRTTTWSCSSAKVPARDGERNISAMGVCTGVSSELAVVGVIVVVIPDVIFGDGERRPETRLCTDKLRASSETGITRLDVERDELELECAFELAKLSVDLDPMKSVG